MGHKKRTRERLPGYREDYFIIIAVEGSKTEKHYFESINNVYRNSRFKIHVIPNIEDKSAPEYILNNLDSYKSKNEIDDSDLLFLVCDKDRWLEKTISMVLTECKQKQYNFIVSNPCFELWLILHFEDLSNLKEEEQEDYLNNKNKNKNINYITSKLKDYLPGYNHSYNKFEEIVTNEYLKTAVSYALKLDIGKSSWPCKLGTQVFKIVEEILKFTDNKG